jgi:CrcB protein
MMRTVLLVAAGGAAGSVLRYLVGVAAIRTMGTGFPWGTLTVNVVGSFVIGALAGWMVGRIGAEHDLWAFAAIGVLGGFTTFSAFSLDALLLIDRDEHGLAALYVAACVIASLLAAFAGVAAGRALQP